MRGGYFTLLARFFPFDYAFGFAQGKLFRCAPLEMTRVEIVAMP
jgi:hypothetical protein